MRLRDVARYQKVERLVREHADGGIDQRGVNDAAALGLVAFGQSAAGSDHRIDAGENVGRSATPVCVGSRVGGAGQTP